MHAMQRPCVLFIFMLESLVAIYETKKYRYMAFDRIKSKYYNENPFLFTA